MARRKDHDQLALFAFEPAPEPERRGVGAAAQSEEVEALGRELPQGICLGGSTWSFPGWAGLVYDRAYPTSKLAREGLAAYARHPLLRAVGVDRTHYAPVEAEELARYRRGGAGRLPLPGQGARGLHAVPLPRPCPLRRAARTGEPPLPRSPLRRGAGGGAVRRRDRQRRRRAALPVRPAVPGEPRRVRRAPPRLPRGAPPRADLRRRAAQPRADHRPTTATLSPQWAPATATTSTPACRTSALRPVSRAASGVR